MTFSKCCYCKQDININHQDWDWILLQRDRKKPKWGKSHVDCHQEENKK
jgi:hypothetical protein